MVRGFFLFVGDIFLSHLKILKFVCLLVPNADNKTLFNLAFLNFYKQAKRKTKNKRETPPFFLGVFFLLIPFKRKEEDIKIAQQRHAISVEQIQISCH